MLARIENTPRDYAWGSRTAIAELLGRSPSGHPEAEVWLGTHPGSPARLADGRELGSVAGELPFLLKILAADAPLSLQAHPTALQAEEGFAREEAAGIRRDDPSRNYKDPFPKPEMIYALSDPFRALCGFRPVDETRLVLDQVADDPRITALLARLDVGLGDTMTWLLGGGDDVDETVAAVVEASSVADGISWEVVRRLAETSPGDPGIAISVLLHAVDLRPGEALYLPAGNIHAYVRGVGIELMTASDNVLRGGLTPKHIDVRELLRVLDVTPDPVPYLLPEERSGMVRFAPEGVGWSLSVVERDAVLELDGRPAIALRIGGDGSIEGQTHRSGESFFVDDLARIAVRGPGRVFVAVAD